MNFYPGIIIDNWKRFAAITVLIVYAIIVFSIGFIIGQVALYISVIGAIIIKAILYLKDRFLRIKKYS